MESGHFSPAREVFAGSDTFIGFLLGFSFPGVYTHITNRSPAPHFNEEPPVCGGKYAREAAVGKYIETVRTGERGRGGKILQIEF